MNKVTLKQLACFDLSTVYARSMGGNKIVHYRLPLAFQMVDFQFGLDSLDRIKDKIIKEEGPTEFEVLYTSKVPDLNVASISEIILKDEPQIKKELEKVKVDSLLYEWEEPVPVSTKDRILNPLKKLANRFILKINNALMFFQYKGFDVERYFLSHFKTVKDTTRYVVPVTPLAFMFETPDLEDAIKGLLSDLRILSNNGLIMGHQTMPSIMPLSDDTGSNNSKYAIFCFPIVNFVKVGQILKIDSPEPSKRLLHLLGVQYEQFEGEVGFLNGIDPVDKYSIETVDISFEENGLKAHLDNYLETKDKVNLIAKKVNEKIKNTKIITKSSDDGFNDIAINTTIETPDEGETSLDNLYRKNRHG